MNRRRALMAASQPTFNGKELLTEIPLYGPADEERANLYDFLDSLTLNGREVRSISRYDGRFFISAAGISVNIFPDGSIGSQTSGGGS